MPPVADWIGDSESGKNGSGYHFAKPMRGPSVRWSCWTQCPTHQVNQMIEWMKVCTISQWLGLSIFKSMSYYGGHLRGKNIPYVTIWNKPSYETNKGSIRSSKTLNRWPRFRSQPLARVWVSSSFHDTSYRPVQQTRYGTRSYLNTQSQNQEREWDKYEDVHVHITFVARVAAKKAVTHPSVENTWASSETLL